MYKLSPYHLNKLGMYLLNKTKYFYISNGNWELSCFWIRILMLSSPIKWDLYIQLFMVMKYINASKCDCGTYPIFTKAYIKRI